PGAFWPMSMWSKCAAPTRHLISIPLCAKPLRSKTLATFRSTWPRPAATARALIALLWVVALWLVACSGGESQTSKMLAIATFLPTSGVDAPIGLAMQNAVDLAAQQHAGLGQGYTLTVVHVDAASSNPASAATTIAADPRVMGIVGPLDSQTALGML